MVTVVRRMNGGWGIIEGRVKKEGKEIRERGVWLWKEKKERETNERGKFKTKGKGVKNLNKL